MSARIGGLFEGYGGLTEGVRDVFGGSLAWYSEVDKGALKILSHRFPDVPNVGDVTAVDWSTVEPVDILTGGSPCQDLSHAGRRAGMTEGTRSNLWVAMREAIAQLRPSIVVWENVRGAFSAAADSAVEPCAGCVGDRPGVSLRALGRVLGDLSDLGYDTRWHGLRAADVGAPHGRFRVFVVATDTKGDEGGIEHGDREATAIATDLGHEWTGGARGGRAGSANGSQCAHGMHRNAFHCSGCADELTMLPTTTSRDFKNAGDPAKTAGRMADRGQPLTEVACNVLALLPTPAASRAGGTAEMYLDRLEAADGSRRTNCPNLDLIAASDATRWGDYAAAIRRWEMVLGRAAPPPTLLSKKGSPQLSPRFVEFMMGLPAGWVTDVPGITRNEALKALGNGVVPQQAAAALRTMLAWSEVAA